MGEIAIVGMACRFPGGADLCAYWESVLSGRDCLSDVPADRWDAATFVDPSARSAGDRVPSARGGYIDPVQFDPASHGIMPRSVDGSEPEGLLVLDTAKSALADAGYDSGLPESLRTAVVIGRGNYFNRGSLTRLQHGHIVEQTVEVLRALHPDRPDEDLDAVRLDLQSSLPPFVPETVAGQLTNGTAGRTAERLNLRGEHYVIDAASASALVALARGVDALESGRVDVALVGSVYIQVGVDFPMVFARLGVLSPSGRSRPFAADADGLVPGEGVGVVVLKRRRDAESAGDRVYAVVRGIGLAGEGRTAGPAVPGARGQALAMRRAYRRAGVDPDSIDLIETHGLGVPAADRAELRAMRAVFPPSERRVLGAVSAQIGHAMPASGMAGLIKAALALHHRTLPATPIENLRPELCDERAPGRFLCRSRPWIHAETNRPRRAAVHSFGFAGINAHAVLEEHAASADGPFPGAMPRWDSEAILLGAADRDQWVELADSLADWLERNPGVDLKDVAATLNLDQPRFPFRVGLVASDPADLAAKLRTASRATMSGDPSIRDARGIYQWAEPPGSAGRVAFLYPGEGSQYPGMLADLCPHFPEVRRLLDTADRVAVEQGHAVRPSDVLFEDGGRSGAGLFAIGSAINLVLSAQWALHGLLASLAIRPDAVAGHSSGEFLALGAAGAVTIERSFEDGVGRLGTVYEELENSGRIPSAGLLAVAAPAEKVRGAIAAVAAGWSVAVENCPHQTVIVGPLDGADAVADRIRSLGMIVERLPFDRAYHTPEFEQAVGPVRTFLHALEMRSPRIPVYSCNLAAPLPADPDQLRAEAVAQWTRPVRFRETVERMFDDGMRVFVEVGTRGNLTGYVEDILRGRPILAVAANLPRRSGTVQLNHLVAALFAAGVDLDPHALYVRRRPRSVDFSLDQAPRRELVTLQLGFPQARLSENTVRRLRDREGAHERLPVKTAIGSEAVVDSVSQGGLEPDDEAVLAYQHTMRAFLDTQRSVMSTFLRGIGGPSEEPPVTEAPAPSGTATAPSRSDSPPRSIPGPLPSRSLEAELTARIAQRTGYPPDAIGLDLDLEADLGIDPIKRVEVLADLQASGRSGVIDPDRLAGCRTIRQVLRALVDRKDEPETIGPWVGRPVEWIAGRKLVSRRVLSIVGDPVAENHTLGGRRVSAARSDRKGLPVVPFAVMAETLAQAAAALMPGRAIVELREVHALRWIRYEERPLTLEIRAERVDGSEDEVAVSIRNLGVDASASAPESPVVAGRVVFAARREPMPMPNDPALELGSLGTCRFTADELYDDQWLFHGPAFRALAAVGGSADGGIEGKLVVLDRRGLLRAEEPGTTSIDAVVLDAFTHLMGCWGLDRMREGDVMFPLRMKRLRLYGDDPVEGSEVNCRIRVTAVERRRVRADATLTTPDGRLWMAIDGWEDWRFYWPARYRDGFRDPRGVLLGERVPLPDDAGTTVAVWLEPPADMGRPVWRDVLEWVQLDPDERRAIASDAGDSARRSLRLWGRIAAKEAARRLWLDAGGPAVYPGDLAVRNNGRGMPYLRRVAGPNGVAMPTISLAHTEGVAVAVACGDEFARPGVDVERISNRSTAFQENAFSEHERALLDGIPAANRDEWVARFWCAKEAAAKATGFGLVEGPGSVLVVAFDGSTGRVTTEPQAGILERDSRLKGPITVQTARRGEYAWAWTVCRRTET